MTFEFIISKPPEKIDFNLSDYKSFAEISRVLEELFYRIPEGSALKLALLPPISKNVSIPEAFKLIVNYHERNLHLQVFVASELVLNRISKFLPNPETFESEYNLKGKKVIIKTGNITHPIAEAVVNASNTSLKLGTGISGAIKALTGPGLQAELDHISSRINMDNGDAVITGAHEMKGVRYIIHTASVEGSEDTIRMSIRNSLKICDEKLIKSVSFPALGTGTGSMQMKEFSDLFYDELINHFSSGSNFPETIYLVLLTKTDYQQCVTPFEQKDN